MDPNGSTMAPEGDGNTESPSNAQNTSTGRDSSKKHWIITLKASNGSNGSITSWIREHCSTAVWQLERGTETNYVHWQITMTLSVKQRLSWLRNHFCKTAHAEIIRNIDAAYDYTQKTDTRIAGPFYWPEPIKSAKDPLEDKTLYEWQNEMLIILKNPPNDRKIYWLWNESGNCGKTSFAKHLVLKHNATVVSGKKNDILYVVSTGVVILLVDISRTVEERVPYETIEYIKNGLFMSGKYESKSVVFDPPHIIVFANFEPNTNTMTADRWEIWHLPENASNDESQIIHRNFT